MNGVVIFLYKIDYKESLVTWYVVDRTEFEPKVKLFQNTFFLFSGSSFFDIVDNFGRN